MPTPSKETQEAEAANRDLVRSQQEKTGNPQATAQELAEAAQVFDDPAHGDIPEARAQQEAQERNQPPEKPVDLRAAKRAEITKGWRDDRNKEAEAEGENFAHSGMPKEFGHPVPDLVAQEEPAAEEVVAEEPVGQRQEEQPRKYTVKVRGKEYEVSEEEYHAAAQKGLAGDNYLDEAKSRLNQVEELYRNLESKAQHLGQPGVHPAGQTTVQPGQQEPKADVDPQHQEDDALAKAIELIQYGDPGEATALLNSAVEKKAAQIAQTVVKDTLQSEKLSDEAARTSKVLKDFEDQHPDLAKDPRARGAIRTTVVQFQRDDLEALGVDPDKLPTRSGRVTEDDIANAHRWYRTQGYQVRTPAKLLEDAHGDFIAWRGQPTSRSDTPADPSPHEKAPPRIEVRVDRTARRQSIPQQPSRSAAPQRQMTQPAPQPRDRSSVVEGIKAQRAQLRGKVLGA